MTRIDIIIDADATLGEGPRWHAAEQRLYWVDIARHELHCFDPATGIDRMRRFDAPVGCFAFRSGGGLVLAMKDGFALLDAWDDEPRAFGPQILAGRGDLRFNDGRTDPLGRFWAGTVNTAKSAADAALYRLDPDGSVTEVAGGMTTCNGAAFTADGRRMFHTDTPSHTLRTHDVRPDGTLAPAQLLRRFPRRPGSARWRLGR